MRGTAQPWMLLGELVVLREAVVPTHEIHVRTSSSNNKSSQTAFTPLGQRACWPTDVIFFAGLRYFAARNLFTRDGRRQRQSLWLGPGRAHNEPPLVKLFSIKKASQKQPFQVAGPRRIGCIQRTRATVALYAGPCASSMLRSRRINKTNA